MKSIAIHKDIYLSEEDVYRITTEIGFANHTILDEHVPWNIIGYYKGSAVTIIISFEEWRVIRQRMFERMFNELFRLPVNLLQKGENLWLNH